MKLLIAGPRLRSIGAMAVVVLSVSTGCQPDDISPGEDRNAYSCTVSAKETETEVSIQQLAGAVVGGGTVQRAAVLVNPSDGGLTYAVTRRYDLSGGVAFGRALLTMKHYLAGLEPEIGANVEALGTAGIAFVYERPQEKPALDILSARLPPSGWTRMMVSLKGSVAGEAAAGVERVLDVSADAELELAAWLTVEADGEFSITRWWGGKVEAGAAVVGQRLGTTEFSGAVTAATEARFDREGRPVQFRAIGEYRIGESLVQTTDLLDLRTVTDPRLPVFLAAAMVDPLHHGPSGGSVFFGVRRGNINLWQLMQREGTHVRARYRAVSNEVAVELPLPTFSVGFRRAASDLTLTDVQIRPPGGGRTLTCSGEVRLTRPAAGPSRPEMLRPRCVPPARTTAPVATSDSASTCLQAPKALLTVTPDALAFPETPVGETARSASFELRNTGGESLRFSPSFIRGRHPRDFTINGTTCPKAPEVVAPGGTCIVSVAFTPTVVGERRARLQFSTNSSRTTTFLDVTGIATNGTGTDADDLPDLVVAAAVRTGTQLLVTVGNTGPAQAPPSSVSAVFIPAGAAPQKASRELSTLPSGISDDVAFLLPGVCLATSCSVVLRVDPNGQVAERDEENNTLSRPF